MHRRLDRPHAAVLAVRAPVALALLVLALAGWLGAAGPALAAGEIRVALVDGAPTVEVGGGPLRVRDLADRALLAETPTWLRLVRRGAGVEVRGARGGALLTAGVRLTGADGRPVRLNARDYPGTIEVSPSGDGLLAVNQLAFEEYLVGTVTAEAGARAPLEMLKAQAIVARTYAAYHWRLNAAKPFHILATVANQQYAGAVEAASPVRAAVTATAGRVLLWQGDLFPAFYHTDSGGHTEDPRVVFAASNMPALAPVRVEFPSDSPHRAWTLDVTLVDLAARLAKGGVAVGRILALEVLERSISMRVARILVRGTQGEVALRGNDFRRLVGYDLLKSTLFGVAVEGAVARFSGRGYGHGVGMDQAAARTMALMGYSAEQILRYHYPGTSFGDIR